MDRLYVYSTLAADQEYVTYARGGADLPVVAHTVFLKGGTGVANDRLVTPQGIATEITAEDAAALAQNPVFNLHAENGFVKIEGRSMDPEAAAGDMNANDEGRQLGPDDFTADGDNAPTPTTGGKPSKSDKPGRSGK
jgi:hypothetical protein